MLLYELLTDRHPFGDGPLPTVIARVLTSNPEPDAAIPADVWPVIARAIQKEPADRFESTEDLLSALEHLGTPSTQGTSGTPGTLDGASAWWRTHQLVVALVYWSMAWPAWHVHKWTGRYGVLTFLLTVVSIIVAGNLRLHLWFTSRTFPPELSAQRAQVWRGIRVADYAFALIMAATGLVIADAHTGWGALFVSMGLGAALAFLVIEPATARAAFKRS